MLEIIRLIRLLQYSLLQHVDRGPVLCVVRPMRVVCVSIYLWRCVSVYLWRCVSILCDGKAILCDMRGCVVRICCQRHRRIHTIASHANPCVNVIGATAAYADYQLRPNFCVAMVVAPELFTPANALCALGQVCR